MLMVMMLLVIIIIISHFFIAYNFPSSLVRTLPLLSHLILKIILGVRYYSQFIDREIHI